MPWPIASWPRSPSPGRDRRSWVGFGKSPVLLPVDLHSMQILSVALKNFKTHRDRVFTFAPGTNAICGENGAGKTSILEAIAWVLFNYQGDYKKEDLIRNGSGSAEATVEFISHQDGRTYTVQRSTTKGYVIFDPQQNVRLPYTRIKDEVLPWLREHMGVAPGTDLGELFARTVGVPQGTFTADFLQTAENRKTVFDKVLKVEEYKTVHKELNTLRRYAEDQVDALDRDIAQYEERLQGWDDLHQRHQTLAAQIAQNDAQLTTLDQQLAALQQERDALKAEATRVQALQTEVQQARSRLDQQQQHTAMLQTSLAQAQHAAALCTAAQPAYAAYQAAEATLQTLNQRQSERRTLQTRQRDLQKTLDSRAADLTRLKLQLDQLAEAEAERQRLQPQILAQSELEEQLEEQLVVQRTLAEVRGELQALGQQSIPLQRQIIERVAAIQQLQAQANALDALPDLEQQRDRLQQQISRIEAARQFEAELRRLVAAGEGASDRYATQANTAIATLADLQASIPLLSASAIETLQAALQAGITVNQDILADVRGILADLATQTDVAALQAQLNQVRTQISQLTRQQAEIATLPQREQELETLRQQSHTLDARLQRLEERLAAEAEVNAKIQHIEAEIKALGDPKGRHALLTRSLAQQPQLTQRYTQMEAAQAGIQRQIADLETALTAFDTLEAEIAQQTQLKQTHHSGYLQYLQHATLAQREPDLTAELAAAQHTQTDLHQRYTALTEQAQTALAHIDPQRVEQVETTYQDLRSQRDRLSGSLPQQRQLWQELQQQLDALAELAASRDRAIAERKQRDRVKRFITFARKAYKEAGPRITERYVEQISREADRLFRELLNRPNVALTWTRDYDILVQEGPNSRRFTNLSGGEQMCAALAVRLALLKVLADIDIAFFDEPTTNMDKPRRDSLAEAIARIKSFNQLFVISHDDTFEKVTENVIVVEREG